MTRKLLFENVSCSRCGGSGRFSWCQMHGSTCFKCAGAGVVLTKRGHAAQAWFNAKKKKRGSDIVVGETILIDGIPGFMASKWAKVTEVSGSGREHLIVAVDKTGEANRLNGFGDMEVRVAQSKERLAELRTEALAFQATLTKTGTVAKKTRAAVAA